MDDLHKFTQAHCDFTLIVHHIALIALIKATLSAFPSRPVIWVMWWHQRRRNPTAQVIKHAAVLPSLTCQGVFLIFLFIICLSPSRLSRRAFFFFLLGCVWWRVETLLSSESRGGGQLSSKYFLAFFRWMIRAPYFRKLKLFSPSAHMHEWTGKERGMDSKWPAAASWLLAGQAE